MSTPLSVFDAAGLAVPAAITAHEIAFWVIILGILLAMTGAFGDPNLVIVGLVVSIAGMIGVIVDPESTLLVFAGLIPVVGFLLFYLYRFVAFPRSRAPDQTSSADSLLGKRGRIIEEATPRGGEVKLERAGFDPHYQCQTREGTISVDERVIVVSRGGGNVLTVVPEDEVDATHMIDEDQADDVGWKVVADVQRAVSRFFDRF